MTNVGCRAMTSLAATTALSSKAALEDKRALASDGYQATNMAPNTDFKRYKFSFLDCLHRPAEPAYIPSAFYRKLGYVCENWSSPYLKVCQWSMRQERLTPPYTTKWNCIPVAKALKQPMLRAFD